MQAIQLVAYSSPTGLVVVDLPEPAAPQPGEALIEMEYAPVNLNDFVLAQGRYFLKPMLPAVIGTEGAGIVLALGDGVCNVAVGDRVTIPFGTFSWAQRLIVPAAGLFVVDPQIAAQQAALLSIAPTTAALLLDAFGVLPAGSWIAFNAANSLVGRTLIALAKARGYHVVAIVRRPELISELKQLGADVVGLEDAALADQIHAATNGAAITLAFDAVGGSSTGTLAKLVAPGGRILVYALTGGQPISADQFDLIAKNVSIYGFSMYRDPSKLAAATAEVATLVANGQLDIAVARIFRPGQISEAVDHLLHGRGKALIDFQVATTRNSGT